MSGFVKAGGPFEGLAHACMYVGLSSVQRGGNQAHRHFLCIPFEINLTMTRSLVQ